MSNNSQKTPLGRALNQFASKIVADAFQRLGQALPCSVVTVDGAIVTVKFEVTSKFTLPNVTIPMVGAEYIRYPIQVGDKGVAFSADARLAGVSGIGGGTADLSQPANLTALVFLPVSNMNWSVTPDAQAVFIYGPNGVILQDTGGSSKITISPSGIAMLGDTEIDGDLHTTGDTTLDGDANIGGDVNVDGDVIASLIVSLLHHKHTGGTISGITGPPIPI